MQSNKSNHLIAAYRKTKSVTEISSLPTVNNLDSPELISTIVEDLVDGILILGIDGEVIYANKNALRILRQLNQDDSITQVPQEIWHLCQSLIHSRHLFPEQHWLIQSEILTDNSTALYIQARWLQLTILQNPCLLLTLADRYQEMRNIAVEEAQAYGLTPRETQVWLLSRANYTYKQIAVELEITPNTVKKHMRSIHKKQKAIFSDREISPSNKSLEFFNQVKTKCVSKNNHSSFF
ncbi:MAG: helix-turn-helix transcriptional regulator [Cyanobacteria bacterium J06639_18]